MVSRPHFWSRSRSHSSRSRSHEVPVSVSWELVSRSLTAVEWFGYETQPNQNVWQFNSSRPRRRHRISTYSAPLMIREHQCYNPQFFQHISHQICANLTCRLWLRWGSGPPASYAPDWTAFETKRSSMSAQQPCILLSWQFTSDSGNCPVRLSYKGH